MQIRWEDSELDKEYLELNITEQSEIKNVQIV